MIWNSQPAEMEEIFEPAKTAWRPFALDEQFAEVALFGVKETEGNVAELWLDVESICLQKPHPTYSYKLIFAQWYTLVRYALKRPNM